MADEALQPPLLSEKPPAENQTPPDNSAPITPPENESDTKANPPAQAGLVQKILAATDSVREKVGLPPRRGRGRPIIHGKYSKAAGSDGKTPVKDFKLSASDEEIPGEYDNDISSVEIPPAGNIPAIPDTAGGALFRKVCASSLKPVLNFFRELNRGMANKAQVDRAFTEKALSRCEPEPDLLSEFNEALTAVMRKRNLVPENSEEWALLIVSGKILAPHLMLYKEFKDEIARQRQRDLPRPKPAAESPVVL